MDLSALRTELQAHGLRCTAQRAAVWGVLRDSRVHPTAEEIYRAAKRRDRAMSRATVYNTLEALVEAGLLDCLHAEDGTRRYDPRLEPHDHLVCVACGRLSDVERGARRIPAPAPARRGGFEVLSARVEFRGYCADCRRSRRVSAPSAEAAGDLSRIDSVRSNQRGSRR